MSHQGRNPRSPTAQANGNTRRGAGPYSKELLPAARPGDLVELTPKGEVRQVEEIVPQPGLLAFNSDEGNGVTIAANDTEKDNEATELEQASNWLGQLRIIHPGTDLPDGVNVTVDQGGTQAPLYTSKKYRGEFSEESVAAIANDGSNDFAADDLNTHLLEYFIWQDGVPHFTFENTTGASVTVSDLRFQGFQMRLTPPVSSDRAGEAFKLPMARVRE